jgi:hypothetical protein
MYFQDMEKKGEKYTAFWETTLCHLMDYLLAFCGKRLSPSSGKKYL